MAAPVEVRLAVAQIYKLLSCSRRQSSYYLLQSRHMGFMNKLKFLQKRREEEKAEKEDEIVSLEPSDKSKEGEVRLFRKRVCIEEVRSYKPPKDVTKIVRTVAQDFYEGTDNWKMVTLDNRVKKFEFLTKLMEVLDHEIPNMDLHNMNTVEDVVKFFKTEVKDTSALEDMAKLDLPRNLHLNQEYIRFHPDTDKIFDGVSAFPGRETRIMSIKFKRKYKGYDGGDPINSPEQFTKIL